jgi:hypothetical protein
MSSLWDEVFIQVLDCTGLLMLNLSGTPDMIASSICRCGRTNARISSRASCVIPSTHQCRFHLFPTSTRPLIFQGLLQKAHPFRKYRRSTDPTHVQKPGLDRLPFIRTRRFPTRGNEGWLDRGFTNCDNRASLIDSLPPMKTIRRLTRELRPRADS